MPPNVIPPHLRHCIFDCLFHVMRCALVCWLGKDRARAAKNLKSATFLQNISCLSEWSCPKSATLCFSHDPEMKHNRHNSGV